MRYEQMRTKVETMEIGPWDIEAVMDHMMYMLNQQRKTRTNVISWKLEND
jgi:hypothetical protein